jgi:hypothetical protein
LEGTAFGRADTPEGLRAAVKSVVDQAGNLSADGDGDPIAITSAYRVGTPNKPFFSFTLAPDDILSFIGEGTFSPGTYRPMIDDGYYVMLAPLPNRKVTVHFHGQVPNVQFTLDVTNHLTVGEYVQVNRL